MELTLDRKTYRAHLERSRADLCVRIREFADVWGMEEYAQTMLSSARLVAEDRVNENRERYMERAE